MKRVVICTSVHPHDDVRIFHKEAVTLVQAGYDITLLNHEYSGDKSGVRFIRVPVEQNRVGRIAGSWLRYARAALAQHPDICHLHDPELLPAGLWLKRRGIQVIYDAHEDLPKQIHGKQWIPKYLRGGAAGGAAGVEHYAARRFDLIFCATELIAQRFMGITNHVISLHNYPILAEFPLLAQQPRERAVCYVGALAENRGLLQMVQAASLAGVRLYLAGRFETQNLQHKVRRMGGRNTVYLGVLGREQVAELMSRCSAGLVTLHPTPAYVQSVPIKLLEYLAAGLPAIASDFPYWRTLLDGIDCAVFVNPADTHEIAQAMLSLTNAPERATELGQNGRRGVETRYCWEQERKKLLQGYASLINEKSGKAGR
ncbi:glycosyltransferase family 4 protein [Hydrogenoanaerobacterium sp.]|uniref:glycosyltransferase family 4 protein n=1 Tax=Hydrogenoanaerobacterium sp. TaxID=2953763 RepID=UPI002897CA8B|nr:glycosyltransferase family 4 protein [Hydrogenoanaerobacterium sp.]